MVLGKIPTGKPAWWRFFVNGCWRAHRRLFMVRGKQQRDYVYVADVARANVAALSRGEGESINIGTGRAADVNRLFEILRSCHPAKSTFERKPARPGELFRSVLNISKAARVLGWKPRVSLKDGLAETYRYIAAQNQ
jgi:UDP-glucose 4-epimerase